MGLLFGSAGANTYPKSGQGAPPPLIPDQLHDKFKAIILTKTKHDTSGIQISLKGHCITSETSVSLLGVARDCRSIVV